MFKALIHIILLVTCCFGISMAQFDYEENLRHINFSVNYFSVIEPASDSDLFRHGMVFSVSPSLANKYRIRQQRKTGYNRIIDRDIYLATTLAWYKREQVHHALLVQAGPAFRLTLPEGLFFQFLRQAGLHADIPCR